MAVTYVAASTLGAVAANPPTFNLTLPSGANLEPDDIIVIMVMSKTVTVPASEINTPSGYTEKGTKADRTSGTAADRMRVAMFWKRAVAGDDGASVTISRAGTETVLLAAVAYVFRGAETTGDPFDAAGIAIGVGDNVADTDIDFPAFDPAADRHVVYMAWHADDGTTTPTDISNGGFTFTIRNEQETATGTDATAMLWSADHDGTALGAVVKSITSTAGTSIGYVFGLIPEGVTPTRGRVSWAELESPFTATRGRVSWAEFEVPFVATRGRVSWTELETPLVPTRGRMSWTELEAPGTPTRGRVSWVELEVPESVTPTRGQVSFAELEVPFVLTRGRISFAELEAPFVGTRGRVSWTELETPLTPTRGRVSWVEFEAPFVLTRGRVSWAELQVPEVGEAGGGGGWLTVFGEAGKFTDRT